MIRIVVALPRDRDFCGSLLVFADSGEALCGPFPVAARAGDALAAAHGNPSRNPLQRYGDTPTGAWRVREILASGSGTPFYEQEYGPNGVVVLEAAGGEAALADANGRFRLFIQGGELSLDGRLRVTAGAMRLTNAALAALIASLKAKGQSRCDVVIDLAADCDERIAVDVACDLEDPPLSTAPGTVRELSLDVTRRDALRVGAGGAAALNLAVSFVALSALDSSAHAAGYVEVAYNSPPPSNGGSGTLGLYNQTSSNLRFDSSVSLCINSGNVILNGTCISTQREGTYEVTATRIDNGKKATRTITVPAGREGSWSVSDSDF